MFYLFLFLLAYFHHEFSFLTDLLKPPPPIFLETITPWKEWLFDS